MAGEGTEMTDEAPVTAEETTEAGPTASQPWVRVAVVTAAVLAVLLLGAAAGLLIGLPGSGGGNPAPAADSVDVGFAQDMAMHHQQAVQIANTAREKTTSPEIKQIAFDIESTQLEQAGRMEGWLMLWGRPEQTPGPHMVWMAGTEGEHHHGTGAQPSESGDDDMPGMASEEDLGRLRSLRDRDFDVYFLQLMLRHHEGGTPMAQYASIHASEPAVRTLAANIVHSQTTEVDTIRQLLAERGAAPLPR